MGADLFESDPCFRELVALAGDLVGENLERVSRRGPEKKLARTKYLQPLLVAVSLGYLRHLTERGLQPDVVLGHSLGEISALAAAGVVTAQEAVRIAAKRGELMEAAAARVDGAMLVVTTENRSRLLDWLASAPAKEHVVLANDNAPTQIVLSGGRAALMAAAEVIAGGKLGRCRMLPVSGPWHSPVMAEAAICFEAWLRQLPLREPQVTMLFNVTGGHTNSAAEIRSLICSALTRPVHWSRCMSVLRGMNPRSLFEIGPGSVLGGLARANNLCDAQVFHVTNLRGVDLAIDEICDSHRDGKRTRIEA